MNYPMLIALFGTVVLSGSTVLFVKISPKNLKLLLSFSGAFLFAISVLHLIPEVYSNGSAHTGLFILIGFFAQILMEFFSEGIEHGHIHVHKHHQAQIPYAMMLGLSVHSFLEGMPLSNSGNQTYASLATGIMLHNIPIAIALMTMLLESRLSHIKSFALLIVFALITPLGTFTSYAIGQNMLGDFSVYFDSIMAVVIGIFLHISTTILFESSENHRFNLIKFIVIIVGAAFAFVVS